MMGQSVFLLCYLLICVPLIASGHSVSVNDFLFSGGLEFNDLSHPFNNDTTYWPGARKFMFTKKVAATRLDGICGGLEFNDLTHLINNETVTFKVPSKLNLSLENTVSSKLPEGERYSSNEFCAAEHGGTHLDAPYHFNPNGWSVGQIPFENLITPLLIVDLSTLVAGDPDFVLQRVHMDNLFHIDPKRNYTVIFRFGWSQYYGNKAKYLGAEQPTTYNLNFPGISEDVAKWLTETSRNLVGVGVDTPSVDPGSEIKGLAHQIFARHNIFMLENVKMDKTLPSNQCAIMIMPMKIQDGTGAPCRLTAICTKLSAGDLF